LRVDHLAYRTASRDKTAEFFMKAFGYKFQCEFEIFFNDEKTEKAMCIALEPPERVIKDAPWSVIVPQYPGQEFHMPPEIFVSEGTEGSIVHEWVKKRDGIGSLHHVAYQVDDVASKMKEWTDKGLADFSSSTPMICEDLTQVFSKFHSLVGIVFEFINRKQFGFCKDNVKALMQSSRGD
jgi:catechol 2,3-dioxygenase-like lactoylglutathione lyase family enzyme